MRKAITPVLNDMDTANLQFTVSDISIYEAQRKIPTGKHMESVNFLDAFPRFPIEKIILTLTGSVVSCYHDHDMTKSHSSEISLQDSINAASCLASGALLVTADYNDYPRPFFNEVYRWDIANEKGNSQKIYLLEPDTNQFIKHIAKWLKH